MPFFGVKNTTFFAGRSQTHISKQHKMLKSVEAFHFEISSALLPPCGIHRQTIVVRATPSQIAWLFFSLEMALHVHPPFKCDNSAWTEEGVCVVLNSTVTADMNCSYNCGSDCWRVSQYPCLRVYVSVNNTGRISRLSHNEETQDASSEVSHVTAFGVGHSRDEPLTAGGGGRFVAVFLCAQVPEGPRPNAQHHHEHLRASEGQPAGALLL